MGQASDRLTLAIDSIKHPSIEVPEADSSTHLVDMCLTIALHAVSHARHSSAQVFMCLSAGNFSHSFAQAEQASAQAVQIVLENGPPLATICAAAEHTVAQS